jgi:hypothetical protein
MRAAEKRGAAMTLATAAEFATLLAAPGPRQPPPPHALGQLSPRTGTHHPGPQGRTDAQIAR